MNTILRNILAIIGGFVGGSAVNMGILILFSKIIPIPEGVDLMDAESIASNLHLFGPEHFIGPFLAHALGTLAGAIIAFFTAGSHREKFALAIGVLFLAAGIANCFMIPAPVWFIVLDLVAAYIPMGWLGGLIGTQIKEKLSTH